MRKIFQIKYFRQLDANRVEELGKDKIGQTAVRWASLNSLNHCCSLTQRQLSTTQLFTHLPPSLSGMGERIGKMKPVGWDKDSLLGQKRKENNNDNNNSTTTTNVYKTSDAQCNCSPPADWCPAYPRAAGPPTLASHPYILFTMTSDGMEYPFGQFGSAVLALSPPSSCCIPSLLATRTERGWKVLGLV